MPLCECGLRVTSDHDAIHEAGRRHQAFLRSRHQSHAEQTSRTDGGTAQSQRQPSDNGAGQSSTVRCDVCQIELSDMNAYDAHKQGAAHRRALAELASASGTSIHIRCSICERDVPATRWDKHITQDQYHLRQKRFADISAQVQAAAQNRNSITVSGEGAVINLGIIEAAGVQGLSPEQNAQITISNESREGLITLARIGFASSMQSDAQGTSFSATLRGASRFISYGQPRTVTITLHPSPVGRFEDTLELQFHDLHRRERFVIIRSISAVVGFAADYDFLRPHAPYVKPPWKSREPEPRAIPTSRPPTWSKTKWVKKLGEYPIPPELAEALNNPAHQARVKGFMPGELSVGNYSEFWQVLLHIEEDARSVELSRYNLYNTEMKAVYPKYRLSVPGLSEGKPSVIVGDKILVKKSNDDSDSWYMGIVHAIGFKELDLYVNEKFSLHRSGNKADVRFLSQDALRTQCNVLMSGIIATPPKGLR